jgi:hypothetical protein
MRRKKDLLSRIFRLNRISQEQPAKPEHHPTVVVEELRDEGTGRPGIGTAGSR